MRAVQVRVRPEHPRQNQEEDPAYHPQVRDCAHPGRATRLPGRSARPGPPSGHGSGGRARAAAQGLPGIPGAVAPAHSDSRFKLKLQAAARCPARACCHWHGGLGRGAGPGAAASGWAGCYSMDLFEFPANPALVVISSSILRFEHNSIDLLNLIVRFQQVVRTDSS